MKPDEVIHHVGNVQIDNQMLALLAQLQDDDAEIDIRQYCLTRAIEIVILYEPPARGTIVKEPLLIQLALLKQDLEKLRKPSE